MGLLIIKLRGTTLRSQDCLSLEGGVHGWHNSWRTLGNEYYHRYAIYVKAADYNTMTIISCLAMPAL